MSYLEALMKDTDNIHPAFQRAEEPDRIVVPSAVEPKNESLDDESTEELKTDYKKVPKNKNSLRSSKPNKKEQKPKDPNFKDAIKSAEDKLFEMCKISEKEKSTIHESLKYVKDWSGHYIRIDISEDSILEKIDDKEYTFSKKRFLSNKYFQSRVIDYFKSEIGESYLRFFQSRKDENLFLIHIKA